jgi:hypothetical protein
MPIDGGGCVPGVDAGGDPAGDVTGTWAVLQLSTAVANAIDEPQVSRNVHIYVMNQTATGDAGVQITDRLCEIKVDSIGEIFEQRTRMRPKAAPSVPLVNRYGSVWPSESGVVFHTWKAYTQRGIMLADIENDPIPTDPEDPAVFDGDEDGQPGITLILDGFLDGLLYVAQRDWNAYTGVQADSNNIRATADWGAEQFAYGANPEEFLSLDLSVTRDPDMNKHPVIMVRIPDGSDCAYVLANQCQLFGGK